MTLNEQIGHAISQAVSQEGEQPVAGLIDIKAANIREYMELLHDFCDGRTVRLGQKVTAQGSPPDLAYVRGEWVLTWPDNKQPVIHASPFRGRIKRIISNRTGAEIQFSGLASLANISITYE